MPFRQLKSFFKILIGVQYKKKTAATLTVRQRRHSPGIFSAADEVCTPFTQGACPLMSGSCRKHSISSFICLSSIPTNLSACTSFSVIGTGQPQNRFAVPLAFQHCGIIRHLFVFRWKRLGIFFLGKILSQHILRQVWRKRLPPRPLTFCQSCPQRKKEPGNARLPVLYGKNLAYTIAAVMIAIL